MKGIYSSLFTSPVGERTLNQEDQGLLRCDLLFLLQFYTGACLYFFPFEDDPSYSFKFDVLLSQAWHKVVLHCHENSVLSPLIPPEVQKSFDSTQVQVFREYNCSAAEQPWMKSSILSSQEGEQPALQLQETMAFSLTRSPSHRECSMKISCCLALRVQPS